DILINDRSADAAMTADVDAIEENRILDQGIAVDAHVGRQNASADVAAAYDAALADHAVVRLATAGVAANAVVGEYKLGRRQLGLVGPDRPLMVVEIQDWIDFHQIHVGLVVSVERSNVAPVGDCLAVLVSKAECIDLMGADHSGNDVLTEVVVTFG